MTLLDKVVKALQLANWRFRVEQHNSDTSVIEMIVSNDDYHLKMHLQVRESVQIIIGLVQFPTIIPEEYMEDAMMYVNQKNFQFALGGLEINSGGAIKFRHSVDVEGIDVNQVFMNNMCNVISGTSLKIARKIDEIAAGK